MKTILTTAMLAGFLGATLLPAPSALAGQAAAKTPAPAGAPSAADASRGDAYYYFTMGHLRQHQLQPDMTANDALAQQSIDYYKKALELAPGSAVVLEGLAEIYARTQHIRDAVTQAQAALKIDPANLEAHRLLARIYVSTLGDMNAGEVQQENLNKAVEQFEALLKLDPMDAYSALWLARLYRFENRHTEAEAVLRGIVQRNPDSGPALEQLSQLLIDQGRSAEAIDLLKRAAGGDSSPDAYDLLGNAYAQSKDFARAEQAYRKAVEIDPDDPDHRRGLAQALLSQQKYAGALEQYRKLAQADPGNAENHVRMAQINRRLGQFDEAAANLQQAKHLAPGSVEIIYNEALLYQDQGRYGDAVKLLSDTIAGMKSRGAGNPGALAILFEQLGSAYRAQQNYPAAIESFEQMETLGPDARKRGVLLRISTYRDSRDLDRAIAETKKELATSPKDPDLTVTLAMLYGEKPDTAAATGLLQGLLQGNESDQEIYVNLAQVQQRGRQYAEAERSAEKAEQLAQESSGKESAWFMLGSIYERQKKFDQAEQEFRKVLAVNPNSAPVLNYYGYMLADRGIRLDEASSMIRRAVQQEPANGAYLDSLGWVCFKQNKLAEAEESLRKAARREGHDPTILGHLGDVYLKLGQSERAAELLERSLAEWQKALPADYDAERAGETEATLKTLRRRLAQKSIPETVKPQ
ncbi:MAG: tetratricopeptide repeat protein [Acidobacteriia bacterium]|nr:tetratricopeptide repeat protein [Terriglobia bacterium]